MGLITDKVRRLKLDGKDRYRLYNYATNLKFAKELDSVSKEYKDLTEMLEMIGYRNMYGGMFKDIYGSPLIRTRILHIGPSILSSKPDPLSGYYFNSAVGPISIYRNITIFASVPNFAHKKETFCKARSIFYQFKPVTREELKEVLECSDSELSAFLSRFINYCEWKLKIENYFVKDCKKLDGRPNSYNSEYNIKSTFLYNQCKTVGDLEDYNKDLFDKYCEDSGYFEGYHDIKEGLDREGLRIIGLTDKKKMLSDLKKYLER